MCTVESKVKLGLSWFQLVRWVNNQLATGSGHQRAGQIEREMDMKVRMGYPIMALFVGFQFRWEGCETHGYGLLLDTSWIYVFPLFLCELWPRGQTSTVCSSVMFAIRLTIWLFIFYLKLFFVWCALFIIFLGFYHGPTRQVLTPTAPLVVA